MSNLANTTAECKQTLQCPSSIRNVETEQKLPYYTNLNGCSGVQTEPFAMQNISKETESLLTTKNSGGISTSSATPPRKFATAKEEFETRNAAYTHALMIYFFFRDLNSKRDDYLQWPDYFMALAFLAAKRSKDPCSQVGACIVDPGHKIVGLGYNGFPIGCSDDEFPWSKGGRTDLNSKYLYVCHAEMNAILNKNSADVRGCTMYVGLFPCAECAKLIIQAGLSKVIYMSDKHAHKPETVASKRMFDAAGIKYEQYIPKSDQIVIDFTEINWNNMTQMPPSPCKH